MGGEREVVRGAESDCNCVLIHHVIALKQCTAWVGVRVCKNGDVNTEFRINLRLRLALHRPPRLHYKRSAGRQEAQHQGPRSQQ